MKTFLLPGFVLVVLAALSACAPPPPVAPTVDLKAEETLIRSDEAAWNKDWASKDIEKIIAHYTNDATVMTGGMTAMKGMEAIRNGLKPMMTDANLALTFNSQTVDVAKSGDFAVAQGTYTMTVTDGKTKKPVTEKGNYVTTYKKQADGSWKAFEDINVGDGSH